MLYSLLCKIKQTRANTFEYNYENVAKLSYAIKNRPHKFTDSKGLPWSFVNSQQM